MSYTYLFWLGIVVPTSITVLLFILFLVCWFKYNLREKFTKKKHDPHRVNQKSTRNPKPPTGLPPPPPVPNHRSRADDRLPARVIYSTYHDSGMSELHEIHYKFDRPVSQASTDSEDSGFRSSKSAHYLPNRSSEHSIPQDIPLLKPVSSSMLHAQRNPALNAADVNGGPSHGHSNNGPASASSGMSQLSGPLPSSFSVNKLPSSVSASSNIGGDRSQPLSPHNGLLSPDERGRPYHFHRSLPQSPLTEISETRPLPSSQSTPLPYPQWRTDPHGTPALQRETKSQQTVVALVHSPEQQSDISSHLSYAIV